VTSTIPHAAPVSNDPVVPTSVATGNNGPVSTAKPPDGPTAVRPSGNGDASGSRLEQGAHLEDGLAGAAESAPVDEREASNDGKTPERFVMIATDKIDANDYNPNDMAPEKYRVLVGTTKQRGRNPMPIQLRPKGERYVIINGEHNFRAALEAGLPKVLCEVLDVDEFEAMRLTLDYNRHGEHDPLLEGLMFERLKEMRGLSNRALAKEMSHKEGTIHRSICVSGGPRPRSLAWPSDGNAGRSVTI